MTINELRDKLHEMNVSKGWWDGITQPDECVDQIPEKLMLIVSELSEALEYYRENELESEIQYGEGDNPDKPVGVAVELADAIIRILDLCGALGLDIQRALSEKIKYNSTRPYRHGGKLA